MATSKDYSEQVISALSHEDVTYRRMMGEYIIYFRSKVIGGIYDNRFLVKPTNGARKLLPGACLAEPYAGAKLMLHVTDLSDTEFLHTLLETLYAELPVPKKH